MSLLRRTDKKPGILSVIGNTPLVELVNLHRNPRVRLLGKYLSTTLFRSICAKCPP
ncbi:MAG: hypothetical protein V1849_01745 [Chloroflexota bacterium]